MTQEVVFKNLPFAPEPGQVIYVEREKNHALNDFITSHYSWLMSSFREQGLEFCYLPILGQECLAYNAPHLTEQHIGEIMAAVDSPAQYLATGMTAPALVFATATPAKRSDNLVTLQAVTLNDVTTTEETFTTIIDEIKRAVEATRELPVSTRIRFSLGNTTGEKKPRHTSPAALDSLNELRFDVESRRLVSEIKERIEALRNKGVNTMFLHNIIDEGEKLSTLTITRDYRIVLPDYDNMEIKMAVLPRAVFFLFLKHPEGIRFKELPDFYDELLHIYLNLNPNGTRAKNEQSIHDITSPLSNSINEKCARIREAFVANFDDRLARHYYITGKRGEPKRIALDPKMITWE